MLQIIITLLYIAVSFHTPVECNGFLPKTLVNTPDSHINIEELTVAQNIICCNDNGIITTSTIKAVQKFEVDTILLLELDTTTTIGTTPQQLMYASQRKSWVQAQDLELGESLCFHDNTQGIITKKTYLPLHSTTYCISVEDHHNFFITNKHVLVHNFAVVIPICVWTFGEGLAWTSASAIATALTTALCTEAITNFAKKLGAKVSRSTCGTPPPPEDPNGPYSYRYGREGGANYHHQNSNGIKNPAPLDAQKALDNSVAVINRLGESRHRISIEGESFVAHMYTAEGIFHSHLRSWNELTRDMQQALIAAKLVKPNGKIIK